MSEEGKRSSENEAIELKPPHSAEERIRFYEQMYKEMEEQGIDKGSRDIPLEQFEKIAKLQFKWDDITFGKEWEELTASQPQLQELLDWYKRAKPAYSELVEAKGGKLCENLICMKTIPIGGKGNRDYCSEACRQRAKSKRHRDKNRDKKQKENKSYYSRKKSERERREKASFNSKMEYYFHEKLKKDGISERDYAKFQELLENIGSKR